MRLTRGDLQCEGTPANPAAHCVYEQQHVLVWEQRWMNLIWLVLGSAAGDPWLLMSMEENCKH